MVLSGSADCTAILWDMRQAKMLRHLGRHLGPVVSVSINSISGNVVTATDRELRVYSIGGQMLATADLEALNVPSATVVLAPPYGNWQDGVAAVSGHEGGHLILWKLQTRYVESSNDSAIDVGYSGRGRQGSDTVIPDAGNCSRVIKELVAVCTPPKTHRADISCLRLCSSSPSLVTKSKPLVPRSFEGGNALELLVGDVSGIVSRWCPVKLDQLPQSEVQQIFSNHFSTNMSSGQKYQPR